MRTFADDPEFANLTHNLTVLREQHGLSRKKMAGVLHISLHSLSMLEEGRMPPRLGVEVLFYAQAHFGVRAVDLLRIRL